MKIRSNNSFTSSLIILLTSTVFVLTAHAAHHEKMESHKTAKSDIVDTAIAAGSFKTLATALTKADLVETLKGDGPFTVFAPTDEAFAKLPKDKLEAILADKELLTSILTYHVVAGKVAAKEVMKLESATTVQGSSVAISIDGGVKVNDANVIKTDIMTSNGIIHVIDTVLVPSS